MYLFPSAGKSGFLQTIEFYFLDGWVRPAPNPGCDFVASTFPKKTGEKYKIILFNEYDESEWSSVMTNHDNFQLNRNRIFGTLPHSIQRPDQQNTY